MAGFFNGLLRKRAKASRIVYISWLNKSLRIICYAPSREFDQLMMKFDLISVIFQLHGLSTVFRNFLKNVKTQEPITYITILSIPQVISERNIKESIFPTLCRPSRGGQGEWLLKAHTHAATIPALAFETPLFSVFRFAVEESFCDLFLIMVFHRRSKRVKIFSETFVTKYLISL